MFREWVGDRVVNQLAVYGWTIANKKFETTVGLKREVIEDDRYGVYGPMFKQMGIVTKKHPDRLIFPLLNAGFASPCYDGQNFFSATHPVSDENDNPATASNVQAGTGPAWFLLDATKALRPVIWQKRIPYEFQALTSPQDEIVFVREEYLYGVRARVNAGYGLWQTAFGSQAPLNAANYGAARMAMMKLRGDRGSILGVTPNVLVVPPELEAQARTLLKATTVASLVDSTGAVYSTPGSDGVPTDLPVPATNIWYQSADLIVTPFLDS